MTGLQAFVDGTVAPRSRGGGGGLVGGVLYKHGKVGRCKPSESKFGMGKS